MYKYGTKNSDWALFLFITKMVKILKLQISEFWLALHNYLLVMINGQVEFMFMTWYKLMCDVYSKTSLKIFTYEHIGKSLKKFRSEVTHMKIPYTCFPVQVFKLCWSIRVNVPQVKVAFGGVVWHLMVQGNKCACMKEICTR